MSMLDPYVVSNSTGELPAEQEIAILVVRKILPELRSTLATLNGMQQTWHLNGMPELIAAAAKSGELLAGHSAEDWVRWGTVLTAMQEWLQVPIESIGATPAQVLLKRYVSQEAK
ncbi:MAG: hypothetical protein H6639_23790 [Caldilineaceae bacterium]|nr:hypothetical protein [Caldilineaceae bacterium]MCB9117988.1 hypothetical protein [Caldilineaceae bacterium]MCB9125608.1 hypothetical protein [Caldilineaceae bacterium]